MSKNSGLLVEVRKDGRIGRTYNNKLSVYGKIVVYIQKKDKKTYETGGRLFNPQDLKTIGYID